MLHSFGNCANVICSGCDDFFVRNCVHNYQSTNKEALKNSEGLHMKGGGGGRGKFFEKISAPLYLTKTFRMRRLSAISISIDSIPLQGYIFMHLIVTKKPR
jgi:hypothetical protein